MLHLEEPDPQACAVNPRDWKYDAADDEQRPRCCLDTGDYVGKPCQHGPDDEARYDEVFHDLLLWQFELFAVFGVFDLDAFAQGIDEIILAGNAHGEQ